MCFSSKGLTAQHGFTDVHPPEVEAEEQLIASAAHTILEMSGVDAIITDSAPGVSCVRA